jgi:uncharacterized membrane protein YccC
MRNWEDCVLTLDDQLSSSSNDTPARDALFQVETQMARLVVSARTCAMEKSVEEREVLAKAFEGARAPLREGREEAAPFSDLQEFLHDAKALVSLPEKRPATGPPPPAASAPPATRGSGLRSSTEQAIQAALAAALSMFLGHLVSPTRWIWAVIATFVVFTRTNTRGETLLKAWQRVLGTLVGAAGGLLLVELIRGHRAVELTALFLFVFLAYYLLRVTYAGMVLSLTVALSLLYVLLGRYTPGLLLLRLGETLLGAAVAGGVAAFVFPRRTTPEILNALSALLHASSDVLTALSKPETPRPLDAATLRPLTLRLRTFRTAALPWRNAFGARRARIIRQLRAATGIVFWTRDIARDPTAANNVSSAALKRLAATATRLAQSLGETKAATDTHEVEEALEHLPPGALQQLEENLAALR